MAQAIATAPERRNRMMVLVALLFAVIAAVLVYAALQSRDGGSSSSSGVTTDTTVVVTASRDVPANTILTADMLQVRDVPVGSQLDGVFASTAGVVGLPTRFPLEAGEQITPMKVGLTQIEDENDVALVLPAGMRGFSVEVSEVTGVGGLLLPGQFVDVIAVYDGGSETPRAETLLQDIELIAVGQEAQEAVPATGDDATGLTGQRPEDVERQPDATSATLAVEPQDAQMLALVQQSGAAIWLSLRPAGDHEEFPTGESALQPPAEPAP
jgi:pilus assembly protein CpaB